MENIEDYDPYNSLRLFQYRWRVRGWWPEHCELKLWKYVYIVLLDMWGNCWTFRSCVAYLCVLKWFFICCDNGLNCCLSQHNNHLSSWLLQVLIWMVFSEGSLAQLLGTPILLQTRTWLWIGERTRCTITCLTQRRCVWLMVSFNFIACDNSKIKEDLLYTHHTWSCCLIMAARWSCV